MALDEEKKDDEKKESTLAWFRGLKGDLDRISNGNGGKILIQLFTTYFFFCKSLADDLVISTFNVYFLKKMLVNATVTNTMQTVALSPWGLKTLWGSMSDSMPIFGYNKRYYICGGIGIAIVCCFFLASVEFTGENRAQSAAILFFGFSLGGAVVDSLSQARYTEIMKATGSASIVSFVWGLMMSCGILTMWSQLLVAPPYTQLLWIALPCCLVPVIPAVLNYLQEEKGDSTCKPDCSKMMQHKGIFALAMVQSVFVLGGNGLLLTVPDSRVHLGFFAFASVVIVGMAYAVLPRNIADPSCYMVLCTILRLTFTTPIQAWYTAPPDCIPGGPAFKDSYYQFVGSLCGTPIGLLAVFIFEKYMLNWQVRKAFWVTTALQMVTALLDVMVMQRWNKNLFGYAGDDPNGKWVDQAFFIFGAQAMDKLIYLLDFLPNNVLIGKLCPKGIEATIFAILAAMQNFGTNVSRVNASLAMDLLGITIDSSQDVECTNPTMMGLNGMSWMKIIGFVILPALTIPLTFVLLPDYRLDDNYLGEEEAREVELTAAEKQVGQDDPRKASLRDQAVDEAGVGTPGGDEQRKSDASAPSSFTRTSRLSLIGGQNLVL